METKETESTTKGNPEQNMGKTKENKKRKLNEHQRKTKRKPHNKNK